VDESEPGEKVSAADGFSVEDPASTDTPSDRLGPFWGFWQQPERAGCVRGSPTVSCPAFGSSTTHRASPSGGGGGLTIRRRSN